VPAVPNQDGGAAPDGHAHHGAAAARSHDLRRTAGCPAGCTGRAALPPTAAVWCRALLGSKQGSTAEKLHNTRHIHGKRRLHGAGKQDVSVVEILFGRTMCQIVRTGIRRKNALVSDTLTAQLRGRERETNTCRGGRRVAAPIPAAWS